MALCFRFAMPYTIATPTSAVPFKLCFGLGGVQPIRLPPRSPNLNAYAERWVRSIKHECLSKLILFGELLLRRAVTEFSRHYQFERNHQGKENMLLFPTPLLHPQIRIGLLLVVLA